MTRFKELCLDVAAEDRATGPFWAALTGCRYHPDAGDSGPGDVLGEQEGMGIALCPVPEPKTVKNRVHLDVRVGSLDEVVALGGSLGERHARWTVCTDPAGNEFCAFVGSELPSYRVFEIAVDAADAEASARWWGTALGAEVRNDGQPWWWVEGVGGFPTAGGWFGLVFNTVPEPKRVKNRLHWDLYGDPEHFLGLGATHMWDQPGRTRPVAWTVLADPEGNEFCVFPEPATAP